MSGRKPPGRRYEVYTDPDLHHSRAPRLPRGAWVVILLACVLAALVLGHPLRSMLAGGR
jgi:hypothetical protein